MATTVMNTELRLGPLVIPVAAKKIKEPKDVTFERRTSHGNTIARPAVDSVTAEPVALGAEPSVLEVAGADQPLVPVYGVTVGDEFREIPIEAINATDEATLISGIEIVEFVGVHEVPVERIKDAYFLAPPKGAGVARNLRVLHDAMRRQRRAAVVRFCPRSRQRLGVVIARRGGMFCLTLEWAADFAQADQAREALAGVRVDAGMVEKACELVDAWTNTGPRPFAFDTLVDERNAARQKLIDDATAGKTIVAAVRPPVVDPMSDLDAAMDAAMAARR